jgi:hypothetical protein
VSGAATGTEATGIGHVGTNKGGISISFSVNGTSFLFIGSHLAAHQEKVSDRNSDYREIINGIKPLNGQYDATNETQYVFWMGDLNYRLDIDRPQAIAMIQKGRLEELYQHDQLAKERKEGKVFCGFNEAKIVFNPTYKYERGNRNYTEEKQRVPSWCDRILWKSHPDSKVTCLTYECADDVMTSDHSPVYAIFSCAPRLPVSAFTEEPQLYSIRVIKLQGEDLIAKDVKTSDPYCVFSSNTTDGKSFKTKVISSNLNPQWDKDTVVNTAKAYPAGFVMANPLMVAVMDKDTGSKDDKMGQGAISLRGALGTAKSFECPLLLGGLPAGTLRGYVLVYEQAKPPSEREIEEMVASDTLNKAMRPPGAASNKGKKPTPKKRDPTVEYEEDEQEYEGSGEGSEDPYYY